MSKSIVCTLFEGHYHYGVAALSNSLYKNGFRGDIYVGYRGALPPWATESQENLVLNWEGAKTFAATDDLNLHFLPLKTNYHLTNYKPKFMLDVINLIESSFKDIYYFDPDIVIKANWSFFTKWSQFGIAVVHENIWNDMPYNHPKRMMWLEIAEKVGLCSNNKLNSNINAGFIGINYKYTKILNQWNDLILYCTSNNLFNPESFFQSNYDYELFKVGDQDLLNLSLMCTDLPLSEFGPDGMDFVGGGWLMSHAIGSPKPWNKNFIKSLLINATLPSIADKEYWNNTNLNISLYNEFQLNMIKYSIKITSLIGRFYRK